MTAWLPVLPVVAPLLGAALAAVARRQVPAQRLIALVATSTQLAAAGVLLAEVWRRGPIALHVGGWPAPFGIVFAVDLLGATMAVITGVIGTAVAVYARADADAGAERDGFHPLYLALLAGVAGAFLTGDLFNLYVWFEVMLAAAIGLLLVGTRPAQLDGTLKYALLNLIGTTFFLVALGWLYGLTGTLNMADLHVRVPAVENRGAVLATAMLLLVAFGAKSAVFPLFFWLPASYHTPLASVSAVFAGLLTKVGVYALLRVFTLVFAGEGTAIQTALCWIAGATMVTGVLGAAAQQDVRRILSFHIVSQIGYMVLGLALYTPLGMVGAIFYVVHHIVVKANLFLVGGVAERLADSGDLRRMGGLYRRDGLLAVLFAVPAASLAGLPPLSGFWAKLLLLQASLAAGRWALAATALVVGLLTLYSMTKIWNEAFWKDPPEPLPAGRVSGRSRALLLGPIAALAAVTVAIGLWTQPFVALAERGAATLLDPAAYVAAVRGVAP